jgi:polysaccharide pyruvyl transferase WcaK-like protein
VQQDLIKQGYQVVVACNDRADLPLAHQLFRHGSGAVVCPDSVDEYFELLANASAVISGRLHTAVVAFSLGVTFLLVNIDKRTEGFIKTYGLEDFSVDPSPIAFGRNLNHKVATLLSQDSRPWWQIKIAARDEMHSLATTALREAINAVANQSPVI